MGGFGELALLYDCPRAASVIASVDSVVWKLDRETFRHTLAANTEKNFADARDAVCKVPLLQDLSAEQLTKIAEAVQTLHYKRDDKIITKGDTGSLFYIVKSGSVVCTDLGSEHHKLDDLHLGVGDYFGERALLLNEPRAATVIVTSEEVTCLVLDRDQFEMLLGPLKEQLDFNLGLRVLASVEMLTKLSDEEKDMLVQNLDTRVYNEGDYVIRQGENGEEFFIVKNGELNVTTKTADMLEPIVVAKLKSGSFFGEQALLNDSPRGANVVAVSPVTVFVLARTKFEAIFGSLQSILERVVEDRQIEVKKVLQEKGPAIVSNIPFENLDAIKTLGTGTFGRVKIAKDKVTGKVYALKILQKAQIVAFRQQKNVMNEKMILMQANHPFVLQLIQTFKNRDCLFMLLELVQGGELFSLLHNQGGKIESKKAQFYAACVLSVLSFLHEKSILYRDLKPENLLIDAQGYIKVVDFGFAKIVKDRTFTLCGTPEYLAPELVLGKGHNKGVDYWALGVLIYEMLNGVSPFADTQRGDQMTICRNILKGKLEFPNKLRDNDAKDLIKQLLHRDPTFRIGSLKDGAEDIKRHAWFKDLNWSDLLAKKLTAPWIPPLANELDSSNFEDYEEDDYVNEYVPEAGAAEWDADF
jgi:CRP-like cAMP-binding protein